MRAVTLQLDFAKMKYNGFLSYSHAADDKLAPALQLALHSPLGDQPFPRPARIGKKAMGGAAREALFISHASPEDNAFTLWLGAKLNEVFADVLRLRGGDDWERVLETGIRRESRQGAVGGHAARRAETGHPQRGHHRHTATISSSCRCGSRHSMRRCRSRTPNISISRKAGRRGGVSFA